MAEYRKITAFITAMCVAISGVMPIFADETEQIESGEVTFSVTESIETTAEAEETTVEGEADTSEGEETAEEPKETGENGEETEPAEEKYTYAFDGLGTVKDATVKNLGASVTYYNYKTEIGGVYQSAHVAIGDPLRGAFIRGVSLGDSLGTRGKVTSLRDDPFSENRLVAAVNADFFSFSTGIPIGIFVEDGRLVSSSDNRYTIGIGEDGSIVFGKVGDSLMLTRGELELPVAYVNKYPTIYGAYLLTRDYGTTTRLSSSVGTVTEYVIEFDGDIRLGESVRGVVKEVRTASAASEIPEGCAVLVVPDIFMYSPYYKALVADDEVELHVEASEEFCGVVNAIGGGDIILKDGEPTDTLTDEAIETARNPRTALGVTTDGKIVLLVVDGRQKGYSSGVIMTALANAMKSLGCVSAINLDGGGSSIMALYGAGSAAVINSPSDGGERAVPNAIALYESREIAGKLNRLSISAPEALILSGASIPLEMSLVNSLGESVEIDFNEENTSFFVDERFGSVAFEDGVPVFTAAQADGIGKITASVTLIEETVSAELFLSVTTEIDSITLDQNIVIAQNGEVENVGVSALFDGREVWFGDMLTVVPSGEEISCVYEGRVISVGQVSALDEYLYAENGEILPEETELAEEDAEPVDTADEEIEVPEETTEISAEETEEPEQLAPAHGSIEVILGEKSVVLPVYFDSELTLDLIEIIEPFATVKNEGYTVEFDLDNGSFAVSSPIAEETTAETTTEEPEPTDTEAETVTETETETVETSEPEPTETETEQGSESEPTETDTETETEDTAESGEVIETTEPTETEEPIETTEPEPEFEPFDVKIEVEGAILSSGLSGRKIWMWTSGLDKAAEPYAELDTESGVQKLYYDCHYDFRDYNGVALLSLSVPEISGIASLRTLLGYTAYAEEQYLVCGAPILTESLDTNLYADTAEHWSRHYVNSLSYMGIVNGSENMYGELVYTPDGRLNREQFAKILVNYLKIDLSQYEETELDFVDGDSISEWAIPFVRAAVGAGYMRGRGIADGEVEFAPTDSITREEAIYVLGGLLGEIEGSELEFADSADISDWSRENLSRALTAGLISGYEDGTLRPRGSITRAEAATVVVRLYEYSSKPEDTLAIETE